MNFIKKNLSNILFIGFIIFLFTPYGLPVRAGLIKVVSMVTTRVFQVEIDEDEREELDSYRWKLASDQGEVLDFQSFEGEVVLINYWATWCPPCVAEMSSLQSLFDAYGEKVKFVFVTNDDEKRVNEFLLKNNYSFPVYYQITQAPEQLRSSSLPTTILIDRTGRIAVEKVGAADWNSKKVRKLLENLLK